MCLSLSVILKTKMCLSFLYLGKYEASVCSNSFILQKETQTSYLFLQDGTEAHWLRISKFLGGVPYPGNQRVFLPHE